MRFTQKPGALYAILLGTPPAATVTLRGLRSEPGMTASLLGLDTPLTWQQASDGVTISFPASLPAAPALALKISPQPALAAG